MSDLSMPPLDFTLSLPMGIGPLPTAAAPRGPFEWPAPPLPAYADGAPLQWPVPCEIEGTNGVAINGHLRTFDPATEALQVQVSGGRSALPLRFAQFRKLTLKPPLLPSLPAASAAQRLLDDQRPLTDYKLRSAGGQALSGRTCGHVETPAGIFLFEPFEDRGALLRVFVPRHACEQADLGPRIGDLLIQQQAASPEQVEAALAEQQRLRTRRIGDLLVSQQVVTPQQLDAALEQQARMPPIRLGEALLALGLINQVQLDEALQQQRADRTVPIGELLVRCGFITRTDLQAALARKMGYPVVDVSSFPADAAALGRVPFAVAARLQVLPLAVRGARMVLAMEDPTVKAAREEVEFVAQCKVLPVLALAAQLQRAIVPAYEKVGADIAGQRGRGDAGGIDFDGAAASELVATLEQNAQGSDRDDEPAIEQSDNSLVRLVNTMIIDAHLQRVSDIHIETQPGRDKVRIRFRRDGLLKPYLELPHTYRAALIARIKIMCDLDISERRKPQDGKINFSRFSPQHKLELRVATIPTTNGLEDVVMRLLASAKPIPMDQLGLSPANLQRLREAVRRPYGMVLCVGPTGSGKTTTLHSALGDINTPDRKIWTAEDPVEITQPGLRQVQVNPKIDWTFAKALRSFLRADPDVIMVGEIRDRETAQTAIEASLTGHLVLSTLHTNSAPETLTRLLDMGMDPFNFADSLLAVLAQRLVRKLCPHCRTQRDATEEEIEELLADYLRVFPADARPDAQALRAEWTGRFGKDGRLQHYHAPGCGHCEGSGFRSRAGLHELVVMSPELRRLITTGGRVEQIQHAALARGMRTLRQDGIEKVLLGLTTIDEVRAMSNV